MSDVQNRWPMFRRVERRARRTQDMMERLDVDPLKLARLERGQAYAEARQRCLECGTSDRCLRWLEMEQAGNSLPDFCPNLKVFLRCRRLPNQNSNSET